MTPEEKLVRRLETALATYDAAKEAGERPAPTWLQQGIKELREGIAAYRKAHPAPAEPHVTCPRCGRTSYHPQDIANHFCAVCGFWGEAP